MGTPTRQRRLVPIQGSSAVAAPCMICGVPVTVSCDFGARDIPPHAPAVSYRLQGGFGALFALPTMMIPPLQLFVATCVCLNPSIVSPYDASA
jgi:hypothetical protein